jgi:hypothetical protein
MPYLSSVLLQKAAKCKGKLQGVEAEERKEAVRVIDNDCLDGSGIHKISQLS